MFPFSWMCLREPSERGNSVNTLMLKPLQQAFRQSVPEIHHSDQGVQYLSSAYLSTLTRHGVEISLARRGWPWENGYAERLIRTLKEEEVHLNDYENITQAQARIGHFCTAYGFLDHSLKEDCDIIQSH